MSRHRVRTRRLDLSANLRLPDNRLPRFGLVIFVPLGGGDPGGVLPRRNELFPAVAKETICAAVKVNAFCLPL